MRATPGHAIPSASLTGLYDAQLTMVNVGALLVPRAFPAGLERLQVRLTYADPVKGMLLAAGDGRDHFPVVFRRPVVTTQLMRKGIAFHAELWFAERKVFVAGHRASCLVAIAANSVTHAVLWFPPLGVFFRRRFQRTAIEDGKAAAQGDAGSGWPMGSCAEGPAAPAGGDIAARMPRAVSRAKFSRVGETEVNR